MSEAVPQFAGLSLSKISDLGVQVLNMEAPPPPESTTARVETAILESEKARR